MSVPFNQAFRNRHAKDYQAFQFVILSLPPGKTMGSKPIDHQGIFMNLKPGTGSIPFLLLILLAGCSSTIISRDPNLSYTCIFGSMPTPMPDIVNSRVERINRYCLPGQSMEIGNSSCMRPAPGWTRFSRDLTRSNGMSSGSAGCLSGSRLRPPRIAYGECRRHHFPTSLSF